MRLLTLVKKPDFLALVVIGFLSLLFFYNLSGHSLVDFDEAWYASVSANILKTKNPIALTFNGSAFYEHPPLGFNIIALSIAIFGNNELGARLPSAFSALGSIIVLYLTGKELFNKYVGLAAVLFLTSSVWFVYRARTGDLDSLFLFFYLLTFFCAVKTIQNKRWLYALSVSLACTLLVKSLFGLTLLPPIILLLLTKKRNLKFRDFLIPLLLFFSIILFFAFLILLAYDHNTSVFIRYLTIGFKGDGASFSNLLNLKETTALQYLRFGIQKWFYIFIPALFGSFFFIKNNKSLISLSVWTAILFVGFASNNKTEIWHLIPLYAPIALITANFYYLLKEVTLKNIASFLRFKYLPLLSTAAYIISFLFIAAYQINGFKNGIKLIGQDKSPIAVLATEAKNYNEPLYLDTEVAVPATASFYSGKSVTIFRLRPENNSLESLLSNEDSSFLLITEKWKLELDKISSEKYNVISEAGGHLLIQPKRNAVE